MKKTTTPAEAAEQKNLTINNKTNTEEKPTAKQKLETVLQALTTRSINRFEAERFGEHCLNSTISVLRNDHGFNVDDKWEKVPNLVGGLTRCKRYSLNCSEISKALDWLCNRQSKKRTPSRQGVRA